MSVTRFVVAIATGAVLSAGVAVSPAFAAASLRHSIAVVAPSAAHPTLGQQVAAAKPNCFFRP
jgi:hypothetical protein